MVVVVMAVDGSDTKEIGDAEGKDATEGVLLDILEKSSLEMELYMCDELAKADLTSEVSEPVCRCFLVSLCTVVAVGRPGAQGLGGGGRLGQFALGVDGCGEEQGGARHCAYARAATAARTPLLSR